MHFDSFLDILVKIGKDQILSTSFGCLPENVGFIPLAVVIITTAIGIQPTFSGRHTQLFVISDFYRVLTEFAEVHTDIVRNILKCIRPLSNNEVLQISKSLYILTPEWHEGACGSITNACFATRPLYLCKHQQHFDSGVKQLGSR